jgi:hypothetical protein
MSLPNVLENIVGEYTDEDDYKNLIKFNPKVHTSEKLVCKQLTNVPEDTIIKFRDSYNKSLVLIKEFVKYKGYQKSYNELDFFKIDSNYVTGLLMMGMNNFEEEKISSSKDIGYYFEKKKKSYKEDVLYMYKIFERCRYSYTEYSNMIEDFINKILDNTSISIFNKLLNYIEISEGFKYNKLPADNNNLHDWFSAIDSFVILVYNNILNGEDNFFNTSTENDFELTEDLMYKYLDLTLDKELKELEKNKNNKKENKNKNKNRNEEKNDDEENEKEI